MARKQRGSPPRSAPRPGSARSGSSALGGVPRTGLQGGRPVARHGGASGTPPPPQPDEQAPEPGPSQLGDRYRLGDVLGEGRAARVSRATDLLLSRQVAVKVLHGLADPSALRRAVRAGQSAARVSSRNLVEVLDVQGGRPAFLVLELVAGRRLPDVLAGPLPEERAREIADGILVGLMALHEAKLVHRDVTADNVLIDDAGAAVLTSAGLAQAADDPGLGLRSEEHEVRNLRPGPSPEQELGLAADARSDVYAAATLIRRLLPGASPAVQQVLDRATAQDPEVRQPDAAVLRGELRRAFAASRPAPAAAAVAPDPPPPPPEPRPRSVRRGVVALAVLALLVGLLALRDRPRAQTPAPTTPAPAAVQPVQPVPAVPAPAAPAAPAPAGTLAEIIAEADRDPAALGPSGRQLLAGLRELEGLSGAERAAEVAAQYGATLVAAARGGTDSAFADRVALALRPELDEEGLFTYVAQNPGAAGDRGGSLVGSLRGLIAMPDDATRAARGAELGVVAAEWAQQDMLSASIATSTIAVLNDTPSAPSRIAEGTLTVRAANTLTDTGLDIPAGAIVVLTATGEVRIGQTPASPEGIGDRPDLSSANLVPEGNHGALIARIGRQGTPFVVGADAVFPVAEAGRLHLGVNDTDPDGNRGGFEVALRYRGP